ncbi:MAG: hypothetical protein HC884_05310 [Chloroflexaceae bacterium]|nr:hypothetical protein [Chloroflexaceae bacterium]
MVTPLRNILLRYPFLAGFSLTLVLSLLVIGLVGLVKGDRQPRHDGEQPPDGTTLSAALTLTATRTLPDEETSPFVPHMLEPATEAPQSTHTSVAPPATEPTATPIPEPTAPPAPSPEPPTRAPSPTASATPGSYPPPAVRPTAPGSYPPPAARPTAPGSYPAPAPPPPDRQSSQPAPTPSPAPSPGTDGNTSPALEMSQGIGLDLETWEQEHGAPEGEVAGFIAYNEGAFRVIPHKNNHIWYLERIWGDEAALPLDDAREIARRFIPQDATLLETYHDHSSTVDVYHSEWLIQRYPESMAWPGMQPPGTVTPDSDPGDFLVHYQGNQEDRIVSFFITTGRTTGNETEQVEQAEQQE